MTTRRGFLASLLASLVFGKGRSVSPHKPRGRELVDADTTARPVMGLDYASPDGDWTGITVRLNGRPVRLLRSRKLPPNYLVSYDDGRVVASPGLSIDEIERRMRLQ